MPSLLDSLRMMVPHGVLTPREVRGLAGLDASSSYAQAQAEARESVARAQQQYAQAQASAMQSRSDAWEAAAVAQQMRAADWHRHHVSLFDPQGQLQATRNETPPRTSTTHQHLSNRLSSISYALSIGADVGILPDADGEPWLAIKLPDGYSFSQNEDKKELEARLDQPLVIYCQMSQTARAI